MLPMQRGGTIAYTKGTDSITLWPVHCVLLLLWWKPITRSHLFHLRVQLICRMEIGLRSSTRGLLLVCLIMGLTLWEFCGVVFCTGRCSFVFHIHRLAVTAEEKVCILTRPLPVSSFPNSLSYLHIIRSKDDLRRKYGWLFSFTVMG